MRPLEELDDPSASSWAELRSVLLAAQGAVVAEAEYSAGADELLRLQVTTRSYLGCLARHTGGVVLDDGWTRMLGSRSDQSPFSITSMTAVLGWDGAPPAGIVVGIDVLGGVFAINGGALGETHKQRVFYFDPAALSWECLELSHSQWVTSMLNHDAREEFYADLRWAGWRREVAALTPSQGFSIYPPLFTKESKPLAATSRVPVPLLELINLNFDMARQLSA